MTRPADHYASEFARAAGRRLAGEPSSLGRRREQALARFTALGFPTTRDEEWRFTSVAPIAERAFALAGGEARAPDLSPYRLGHGFAAELVFVDGRFASEQSSAGPLPRGAVAGSLGAMEATGFEPYLAAVAPYEQSAFVALNTAFFADGACLHVPPHTVLERPIHVLFVSTGRGNGQPPMTHPRVLVVLGDQSQASLVVTFAGPDAEYFTNAVTEVVLGADAVLDHYNFQREGTAAFHVGGLHLSAGRGAHMTSHSISLGGSLVRNDVMAVLGGDGAESTLYGLYLADGSRLVDNHTTIDHAMPHCGSREIYKGILAERARGVFNGKIIVRPDAQKTDAKQTNRALLLSEDAQINTKPQLEIFANDVKCTHGAAVGQLDEEAVFYLRSRGLAEADARRLLIHAFAGDVVNRMPLAAVRGAVEGLLQRQLARALPAAA